MRGSEGHWRVVYTRIERQGQVRYPRRRYLQLRRDWVHDGHYLHGHGGHDLGRPWQGKIVPAWQPHVDNSHPGS